MLTKITFLEGFRPLVKTYTPSGVESYPLVKTVTSHSYSVAITNDGLDYKHSLLLEHAEKGHALLKGTLLKELNRESRANQTNNNATTQNIVFDIDGIYIPGTEFDTPLDKQTIKHLAEAAIRTLPESFHNVSYIAHASASMGMKGQNISLHLDFFLSCPVAPTVLKEYLIHLNLNTRIYEEALELTATGTALKYKLDICLADNSRLIFIGHPKFEGIDNPIPDNTARIIAVKKGNASADITAELEELKPRTLKSRQKSKIAELRELHDLPPSTAVTRAVNTPYGQTAVVTNPDQMQMTFAYEKENFVYYNLNNGDSNAYFVFKDNPTIVRNFKGEPPFLFEAADRETYLAHLKEHVSDTEQLIPIVWDEYRTNTLYRALYNPTTNRILDAFPVKNQDALERWMVKYNAVIPETIPIYKYEFNPTSDQGVDIANDYINQFVHTRYMVEDFPINPEYAELEYGEASKINEYCPAIYKILWSIVGSSILEFEHFFNWLAYIFQYRDKTETAWVMHGVPGTGKGVFFEQILKPLFSERYAWKPKRADIDENFNRWLETGLIVTIDEFKSSDSKNESSLIANLKNYITESTVTIRAMRTDHNQVRNYCNFIFFSNQHDLIKIEDGDRRMNVAPRQEKTLRERYPGFVDSMATEIAGELEAFAQVLKTFKINKNQVRLTLDNKAKDTLKAASATSVDDFFTALRQGDLMFFLNVLDEDPEFGIQDPIMPAQNVAKRLLRDFTSEEISVVGTSELRHLYAAMVNPKITSPSFGKMLPRRGMAPDRYRYKGKQVRGVQIQWQLPEEMLEILKENYLTPDLSNVTPLSKAN